MAERTDSALDRLSECVQDIRASKPNEPAGFVQWYEFASGLEPLNGLPIRTLLYLAWADGRHTGRGEMREESARVARGSRLVAGPMRSQIVNQIRRIND